MTELYTLSLHDALPIYLAALLSTRSEFAPLTAHDVNVQGTLNLLEVAQREGESHGRPVTFLRSEEHTSELQSRLQLVCRRLREKRNGRDCIRGDAELLE